MGLVEAAGLSGVGIRFLSELERGKPTAALGKALTVLERMGLELWVAPRGTGGDADNESAAGLLGWDPGWGVARRAPGPRLCPRTGVARACDVQLQKVGRKTLCVIERYDRVRATQGWARAHPVVGFQPARHEC